MSRKGFKYMVEAIANEVLDEKHDRANIMMIALIPDGDKNLLRTVEFEVEPKGDKFTTKMLDIGQAGYMIGYEIDKLAHEIGTDFNTLCNQIRTAFITATEGQDNDCDE